MVETALVWLRNDLRMADNPALADAVKRYDSVVAIYIHEQDHGVRPIGSAGRWWLHHSLNSVGNDLAAQGIAFHVVTGPAADLIPQWAEKLDAGAVFWNRRLGPRDRKIDEHIAGQLGENHRLACESLSNVLVEPWTIATGQGKPYSVYTPFWNALKKRDIPIPINAPSGGEAIAFEPVDTDYVEPNWAGKLNQHWSIGEEAARRSLTDFLDDRLDDYKLGRDIPADEATSKLSPHLRHGEISPRQVWHAAMAVAHADHGKTEAVDKFLSELAWRDFNYNQLFYREDIAKVPMQARFNDLQYRHDDAKLAAWQQGRTGFPIVDAGMRELWETGYMQNRLRLLTASFLAKNLLIDWRKGEQWFWDCLVDGDPANNPSNWQWVAGSGLDASPYFRIFNPVTQGERFDGAGEYVRKWVPELAALPDEWVQKPFEAPRDVLERAGVELGANYPEPIVDLKMSRQRALDAIKGL